MAAEGIDFVRTAHRIALCYSQQQSQRPLSVLYNTRRRRLSRRLPTSTYICRVLTTELHKSSTISSPFVQFIPQTPSSVPLQSGRLQYASRRFLLMGFAFGSLAVMSGYRPFEPSSLSRFFALFELRSMFLAVVVTLVLLVLGESLEILPMTSLGERNSHRLPR